MADYSLSPATWLQVKNRALDTVSVKDFGAVGDGVTDDTGFIQTAILSGAKSILFPEGEYIVSSITNDAVLFGNATIKWKSASVDSMITMTGDSPKLIGLTLDGNVSGIENNLTMVVSDSAVGMEIIDCTIQNGLYKFFQSDVALSTDILISNNVIKDWGTASGCDVFGMRSPRFVISGNRFTNIGDGHCIRTGLLSGDATTIPVTNGAITGNVFFDTEHVGVTAELYTQGLTISGNSFDTLNAGVKIESDGGNQFDISITGNTFKNLDGTGVGTSLNITGDNVVFSSNTVRDCAGVCDVGNGSVVSNNVFDNCGEVATATSAVRATTSSFSNSIVSNNMILNSPYRGIECGENSIVIGNVIVNTADRAINASSAIRARIVDNTIDGCDTGIVSNSLSSNLHISGNSVINSTGNAYSIFDTTSAVLALDNYGLSQVFTDDISSDSISIPRTNDILLRIDTESSSAADDLSTINADEPYVSQTVTLQSSTASRVITVKDNVGNIRINGDCVLGSVLDRLVLMFDGTSWVEITRKISV